MPRKPRQQVITEAKEAVKELFEETIAAKEAEAGERVPGKVVHGNKTTWNRSDVERMFPVCSFTPGETVPVTYNGIRYQLIEGVENHVPTIIRDIFMDYQKRKRNAGRYIPVTGFGPATVEPGAGGLQPE